MEGKSKSLKISDANDKNPVASASVNASGLKNYKIKTENTNQSTDNEKTKVEKANASDSDKGKGEKLDEDVPEDFFDDFLKEDFMAGLDIVDEDNEDTEDANQNSKVQVNDQKASKKKDEVPNKSQTKINHVKKFKESLLEEKRKLSKGQKKKIDKIKAREDELKRLDRELEEIRKAPLKKTEKVGIDADNFDIRRDPEKTRQAIQRDKLRSVKDKEKRLITDIVQTGLVPPGMELEVDMENVCQAEKTVQITDLREKIRSRRSRSRSIDNSRKLVKNSPPRRKHRTPIKRRRSPSPHLDEKLNEIKQSYGRKRSPLRRHPSPHYKRSPIISRNSPRHYSPPSIRESASFQDRSSPFRRNIESPIWSPTRSPTRRSGGPSSWRRSRSKSLTNRRSPYRLSRNKDVLRTHPRGRDRNYSPVEKGRRRRSHSRSPKRTRKEEKVSFLEELVAKLNETHPVQTNMPHIPPQVNYYMPNMNPPIAAAIQPMVQQQQAAFFTPVPVPQPPQPKIVQPAMPKYDPYDESFFIGNAAAMTSQPERFTPSQPERFTPKDPGLIFTGSIQSQATKPVPRHELNKDASKLFGDKRIMLSDFLAITAKPQVNNASSAKLQEKIKVIQRCQDAIKMLNEKKFSGPLIVQKTDSYKYSTEMTTSPLLRKPIIQLPFTTPGLKNSSEMNFTKCCETLLERVGVPRKIVHDKQDKVNIIPPKAIASKDTPLTLPTKDDIPSPIKVITKSFSTQTDKELSSCKECLRRKGILYANCGVQAGDPMLTFSVSTQVTEADFYSMIPKTQSLASLTPAQLLGKQSMISDFNKTSNNLLRGRQVPSPPPPPSFHFPLSNIQSLQSDSYPSHLFGQPVIPSLMQNRNSAPSNKTYGDDRRGVFNKRF